MSYLHALQPAVLHRDLKCSNLLVDELWRVKLCDFGLAAELKYDNDIRSSFCGTLDYIAPEMKEIGLYGVSVDIWGLGILFGLCRSAML